MKLKAGWTLIEMGDEYVAVPTGESAESFRGIVRLNVTCKDIWNGLTEGLSEMEIARKLLELYDEIDLEGAQQAVRGVVAKLTEEGLLVE